MTNLRRIAPPVLPSPPPGPLQRFLEDMNNVLRIYFNSLHNTLGAVTGDHGGRYADVPNALYFSTTDQQIAVVNTAQGIEFEQTYLESGVEINGGGNSEITVEHSGVYNFQFSAQMHSNSASAKTAHVWIAREGTDLGYTAKGYTLTGSGDIHEMLWSFNLDLAAGEHIEMRWAADDVNVTLTSAAPAGAHPGVSSAVMTVNLISTLPNVRPTPP